MVALNPRFSGHTLDQMEKYLMQPAALAAYESIPKDRVIVMRSEGEGFTYDFVTPECVITVYGSLMGDETFLPQIINTMNKRKADQWTCIVFIDVPGQDALIDWLGGNVDEGAALRHLKVLESLLKLRGWTLEDMFQKR